MHGRYNFMNLVNDLATLDQELYKNLMFLKVQSTAFIAFKALSSPYLSPLPRPYRGPI